MTDDKKQDEKKEKKHAHGEGPVADVHTSVEHLRGLLNKQ